MNNDLNKIYNSKYDIGLIDINEEDDEIIGLSQDELDSYIKNDKDKIYYISKVGIPKYHSMCLYTSDVQMKPDDYIKNYNSIPKLYGNNPLNEFDIKIIRMFNK